MKKYIWYIVALLPVTFILMIFLQFNHTENNGEYIQNIDFIIVGLIINLLNTGLLIYIYFNGLVKNTKQRIIKTYSTLLGTPITILIYFLFAIIYVDFFYMKLVMNHQPAYLREECLIKTRNSFIAKNQYNIGNCNQNSIPIDSLIIVEVYRIGNIKSCGIILKGEYKEMSIKEIPYLNEYQKNELIEY